MFADVIVVAVVIVEVVGKEDTKKVLFNHFQMNAMGTRNPCQSATSVSIMVPCHSSLKPDPYLATLFMSSMLRFILNSKEKMCHINQCCTRPGSDPSVNGSGRYGSEGQCID